MKVEFYRHDLGEAERRRILEALDGIILTTGTYVAEAEGALARYLGVPHAVGLDSCTAALHLALLALGVGPGDEVVTTPMTFIATANAVLMCGAEPVFADVEPQTANLCPERAEAAITPRTKAILPVHLYGQLCDMKAFRDLADRRGLALVEDAAHCVEGIRDGVRPGQLGDAACFSFYATKNVTCGEGGALVTRHEDLATRVRTLSQHGMSKNAAQRHAGAYQHWDMEVLGWKYNLDNVRASLLVPQLERIDARRARREEISRRYEEGLAGAVEFPRVVPGATSARHLQTVWFGEGARDLAIGRLRERGVGTVVNYRAIHLLTYYRERYGFAPGAFPVAEAIGDRTLSLPLYPSLSDEGVDHVIESVKAVARGEPLPPDRAGS